MALRLWCPGFAVCALLLPASFLHAESQRFAAGTSLGEGLLEVKVADAMRRDDGHWLTLGSRVDGKSRETAYVVLRSAGGADVASIDLAPDDGLSWSPHSVIPVDGGSDVVVFGIEYDHRDFGAARGIFLARLDGELGVVWSRHLRDSALWFDDAQLRRVDGGAPRIVAALQSVGNGGELAAPDAFVASLNVADGSLGAPRTLGIADVEERAIDVVPQADGVAVLVQVRRETPSGFESSDGIAIIGDAGLASTRVFGHTLPTGVRAQSLRLMRDGNDWVLAGRRTSLGANFFYLHRLADDFAPAATRTLIPFFNAMDVAVRDGGVFLYGEANGEAFDRGSVLMHLDAGFAIDVQRRYATENSSFPSGALAFGEGGLLLALGSLRDEDGFVYESAMRVAIDGEGLLCEEGDYEGFSTSSDVPTVPDAWLPTLVDLDVQTSATAATRQELAIAEYAICAAQDELVFRSGLEKES